MTRVAELVLARALLVALPGLAPAAPETCRTTFDAAALIRSELFFFKDDYFWRLNRAGHLMTRRPVEMGTFWEGLPDSSSVSAAYERPDGSVVFFCGRHFWVFWERRARPGYPRPLSDLGLPEELSSVDAALVSGHNWVTYLVTGHQYWRFNEMTGRVEKDSPLPISRLCRGLPRKLDAAFTDNNGDTFFVQGPHYWRCDWSRGRVQSYSPDLVAPRWLACSLTECCLESVQEQIETRVWPALLGDAEKAVEGNGAGSRRGIASALLTLTAAVVAQIVWSSS